jgi:hypothetical protein
LRLSKEGKTKERKTLRDIFRALGLSSVGSKAGIFGKTPRDSGVPPAKASETKNERWVSCNLGWRKEKKGRNRVMDVEWSPRGGTVASTGEPSMSGSLIQENVLSEQLVEGEH